MQALIDNGADVNAKADNGGTALMGASIGGHKEIVQLLLANGADVNAKGNNGETALMAASSLGHKEIVQLLLAKGADINAKANGGETASTLASREGHKEIVQLLLARGVTEPPPSSTSASHFPSQYVQYHNGFILPRGAEVDVDDMKAVMKFWVQGKGEQVYHQSARGALQVGGMANFGGMVGKTSVSGMAVILSDGSLEYAYVSSYNVGIRYRENGAGVLALIENGAKDKRRSLP